MWYSIARGVLSISGPVHIILYVIMFTRQGATTEIIKRYFHEKIFCHRSFPLVVRREGKKNIRPRPGGHVIRQIWNHFLICLQKLIILSSFNKRCLQREKRILSRTWNTYFKS